MGRAVAVPPIYLVPNLYSVVLTFLHYFVYYASLTKSLLVSTQEPLVLCIQIQIHTSPLSRVIETAGGRDASIPREMGSQGSGPCTLTSSQLSGIMSEVETGAHSKAVSES